MCLFGKKKKTESGVNLKSQPPGRCAGGRFFSCGRLTHFVSDQTGMYLCSSCRGKR